MEKEILKILSIKNPFILFSKDIYIIKKEFKNLAMKWHPDHNKNKKSNEVFSHIKELYEDAVFILEKKNIVNEMITVFIEKENKINHKIRYKRSYKFEMGDIYVGNTVIVYVFDKEYKDFFKNSIKIISSKFSYSSDRMRNEISRYLPEIIKYFQTEDNKYVIIIKKTKDFFLLRDVLSYYENSMDPKHVGWIISSLLNLCCYLNYIKMSNVGISLDTCFISLKYHSVLLAGGWWFSTGFGEKLKGISSKSYDYLPSKNKINNIADNKIDIEIVKMIGRELLGDIRGNKLEKLNGLEEFKRWLLIPSSKDPVKEYDIWYNNILTKTFGIHKFIKIDVGENDIYQNKRNK